MTRMESLLGIATRSASRLPMRERRRVTCRVRASGFVSVGDEVKLESAAG
jgi:hypothetical protein